MAWLDAIGLILVGAGVAWNSLSAARSGGEAGPPSALLIGTAVSYTVARVSSRSVRWLIPGLLVGAAAALLVADLSITGGPLGGVFGYQNASAAFFFQASVAGLMVAVAAPRVIGVIGVVAAVGFAVAPLAAGSITVALLVVTIPAALLAFRGWRGARTAVAVCSVLLVTALVITTGLGAAYPPGDPPGALDRLATATLTERRLVLWSEALDILGHRPLTGVGPGRFDQVSRTARSDSDARWAHHGFLQQGAETGLPGLVILVLTFLWGFARLAFAQRPDAMTGLGAVALAGLGIHATVDYVLHFAAIPLAAAALVGAATVPAPRGNHGNERTGS